MLISSLFRRPGARHIQWQCPLTPPPPAVPPWAVLRRHRRHTGQPAEAPAAGPRPGALCAGLHAEGRCWGPSLCGPSAVPTSPPLPMLWCHLHRNAYHIGTGHVCDCEDGVPFPKLTSMSHQWMWIRERARECRGFGVATWFRRVEAFFGLKVCFQVSVQIGERRPLPMLCCGQAPAPSRSGASIPPRIATWWTTATCIGCCRCLPCPTTPRYRARLLCVPPTCTTGIKLTDNRKLTDSSFPTGLSCSLDVAE